MRILNGSQDLERTKETMLYKFLGVSHEGVSIGLRECFLKNDQVIVVELKKCFPTVSACSLCFTLLRKKNVRLLI